MLSKFLARVSIAVNVRIDVFVFDDNYASMVTIAAKFWMFKSLNRSKIQKIASKVT